MKRTNKKSTSTATQGMLLNVQAVAREEHVSAKKVVEKKKIDYSKLSITNGNFGEYIASLSGSWFWKSLKNKDEYR
jgi:hypothetical protein